MRTAFRHAVIAMVLLHVMLLLFPQNLSNNINYKEGYAEKAIKTTYKGEYDILLMEINGVQHETSVPYLHTYWLLPYGKQIKVKYLLNQSKMPYNVMLVNPIYKTFTTDKIFIRVFLFFVIAIILTNIYSNKNIA